MADTYSTYRGALHPLQDRRAEYHCLNTIAEEDVSDTSPTRPSQAVASKQHRQHQHQQQQQQQRQQQQQPHHQHLCLRDDVDRDSRAHKIDMWLSPMSDHFPTPRGFHFLAAPVLPSSPSDASSVSSFADRHRDNEADSLPETASPSSPWNHSGTGSTAMTDVTEIDDIYYASEGDHDDHDDHDNRDDRDDRGHDGLSVADRKQRLRASGISRNSSAAVVAARRLSASRPHVLPARDASTIDTERRTNPASRRALPQLTIPSVAAAATAAASDPKLCTSPMAPTPSAQVPMSPAMFTFMQKCHAHDVPAGSAPPSLDGSLTSDQMSQMSAQISAPPTPIIGADDDDDAANATWTGVQLQPGALATLQSLARSDAGSVDGDAVPERVLELPQPHLQPQSHVQPPSRVHLQPRPQPSAEMAQNPSQPLLHLLTAGLPRSSVAPSPVQHRSLAGLTRLEIPSPGGFFSGLSPRTRHTWHLPGMTPLDSAPPPTSGMAEQFYRLPWHDGAAPPVPPPPPGPPPSRTSQRPLHMPEAAGLSSSPVEQVIEVAAALETDDPATACRVQKTPLTAMRIEPETAVGAATGSETEPETKTETETKSTPISRPTQSEHSEQSEQSERPAAPSSPVEEVVATEIIHDYRAVDAAKIQQQTALSQLERTELWLMAQRAYLSGIADMTEATPDEVPSPSLGPALETPPDVPPKDGDVDVAATATGTVALVRKKTVHFSEAAPRSPTTPRMLPSKLLHQESAYYRAFTDCIVRAGSADAFVGRLPRFEALQAQRLLLREAHRSQLLGKHQLTVVPQSAKKRMSANVVRGDDHIVDDPAKLRADKEADARSQMIMTTWHVAALKMLNGGRLIAAPVHRRLSRPATAPLGSLPSLPNLPGVAAGRDRARILDLGGQATCDWAWHAALQYPNAKVYSVTTKAIRQLSNANVRGPSNHRQVAVERLTRLPFEDNHFDLVRASELYSVLKFVGENGEDEWESCLRECHRVLKPDGYLEFTVLDADIVNAGPLGNAKSVEFGFVLQTLGYDPAPTKMFLGRLDRAGFADVRRAWLCLPVGPRPEIATRPAAARDADGAAIPTVALDAMVHGTTDHVAAVTGLAGSWSWERWLLRAEMEKIAGDLRLADTVTASPALREAGKSLDGVHAIIEEGRRTGAAWRMLRGYARKPRADMGTINMILDLAW